MTHNFTVIFLILLINQHLFRKSYLIQHFMFSNLAKMIIVIFYIHYPYLIYFFLNPKSLYFLFLSNYCKKLDFSTFVYGGFVFPNKEFAPVDSNYF